MSPAPSTCIISCYATRHSGHGLIAAAEACKVCRNLVWSYSDKSNYRGGRFSPKRSPNPFGDEVKGCNALVHS
jgi:hypothetical protein